MIKKYDKLPKLPFQVMSNFINSPVYTVDTWREATVAISWKRNDGQVMSLPCSPLELLEALEAGFFSLVEHTEQSSTEAPTELEELEARIETLEEYITELVRENKKLKEDAKQVSMLKSQASCYMELQKLISSHESYKMHEATHSEKLKLAILNLQEYWDNN